MNDKVTTPSANDVYLSSFTEPSALVDVKHKLVAWNDAFATVVSPDIKYGDELPLQGSLIHKALEKATKGSIGMGRVFRTKIAMETDWLLLALPSTNDNNLLLLTCGELSQVFTDEITGLPNRRDANNRLLMEWRRMLRDDENCFCVALVDIDHFKSVNDHFGHDNGDEVLRFFSNRLVSCLRSGDWVARWGGEEFLLFLNQTDLTEGVKVSERIRQAIAAKPFTSSGGTEISLTICLGVVCSDNYVSMSTDSDMCLASMVNTADVLLYDAKVSGRNLCMTQQIGEKIYWNEKDLDNTIANGNLVACAKKITDANDNHLGSAWHLQVRDGGPLAPRHIIRSALKQNRANVLDAAWLKQIIASYDPANHGQLLFVPLTSPSLLSLTSLATLITATTQLSSQGAELAFLVDDDEFINEITQAVLEHLSQAKIKLCLRINDCNNIPAGLLNQLNPAYALLQTTSGSKANQLHDIQHMLLERHVQPVLHSNMRAYALDDSLLYLDSTTLDTT